MKTVALVEKKLKEETAKRDRAIRILTSQIEHERWLLAEKKLRDVIDLEKNISYTEEILIHLKTREKDLQK